MVSQTLLIYLMLSTISVCFGRPNVRRNDDNGNYGYNYEITHGAGSSRVHMDVGGKRDYQKRGHVLDSNYDQHRKHDENHQKNYHGSVGLKDRPSTAYNADPVHEPQPIYPTPYDSSNKKYTDNARVQVPTSQIPYDESQPSSYSDPHHSSNGYKRQEHAKQPIVQHSIPVAPASHGPVVQHSIPVASENYAPIAQQSIPVAPASHGPVVQHSIPVASENYAPVAQQSIPASHVPVVQQPISADPENHASAVQHSIPIASDRLAQGYSSDPQNSYSKPSSYPAPASEYAAPKSELVYDSNSAPVQGVDGPKYVLVPSGPPYVQIGHTAEIIHGPAPGSSHIANPASDPAEFVPVPNPAPVSPHVVAEQTAGYHPDPKLEVAPVEPISHSTRLIIPSLVPKSAGPLLEDEIDLAIGSGSDALDLAADKNDALIDVSADVLDEANHISYPPSHSFRLILPSVSHAVASVPDDVSDDFIEEKNNHEIDDSLIPKVDPVPPVSHAFRLSLPVAPKPEALIVPKEDDEFDSFGAYDISDFSRIPKL